MKKINLYLSLVSLIVLSLFSNNALAEIKLDSDKWRYELVPYFWFSELRGRVSPSESAQAPTIDLTFNDLLENLDAIFSLANYWQKGDWAIFNDIFYAKLSSERELLPSGAGSSEMEFKLGIFTLAGAWSPYRNERSRFDILAGIKYWYLDSKMDLTIINTQQFHDKEIWIDPIIGIRNISHIGGNFYLNFLFSIGGFDISADLDREIYAEFLYNFNKRISAGVGWRSLFVDYRDEGFIYKMEQEGPFINLRIIFGGEN